MPFFCFTFPTVAVCFVEAASSCPILSSGLTHGFPLERIRIRCYNTETLKDYQNAFYKAECEREMANSRIARTNDDIQFQIANLLRSVKDPRVQQGMLSVTRVETTGDLRYAKIWISAYGLKDEKEFHRGLKSASSWLRKELARSLNLRYTPELVFELDHSIEYGAKINQMISDLHIEHGEGGEPEA